MVPKTVRWGAAPVHTLLQILFYCYTASSFRKLCSITSANAFGCFLMISVLTQLDIINFFVNTVPVY